MIFVRIVPIYSDPRHVIAYDDGEVRQEFSICFRARPVRGELAPSSESKQVHWVEPKQLNALSIHPSVRLRIEHGLQQRPRAVPQLTPAARSRSRVRFTAPISSGRASRTNRETT